MGIRTNSTLTQECRKGVMEFLLINHPLDCPICDQAGECRLQEFSVEHGKGESRFREDKVKKPKNVDIGPRVRLDDERCIMCSRCIRFTAEIADDPVLGFTERGSHTTLSVHPGKRLENNYSLNTVDICPVGALTSNDFRFQMRVWFLNETKSICTKCGRGCNTEIGSRENTVYRQTPRDNNEVNSSWMCDQGRLDFHFVNSEYRLTDPMVRTSAARSATDTLVLESAPRTGVSALPATRHEITSWKKALTASATGLKAVKADEIAIIASGRMTNEELFMVRSLAKTLGVTQIDVVPRTGGADEYLRADDLNPNSNGVRKILGIEPGAKLQGIIDGVRAGSIKAVLALGENLLKAGFEKADLQKLSCLVSSHILANATADLSHVVLPGSSYAEKRGSMINVTGRLQRLNRAINSPGNAHDTWEILRDLIVACGGSNGLHSVEDVFKHMASEISIFEGLTLTRIGDLGVQVMETSEKIPLLEREKERKAKGMIVG
jgi:NADH-quinone oxidoreductase subunit G